MAVSLQRKGSPQGLCTVTAKTMTRAEKLSPVDELKGDNIMSSSSWTLGYNHLLAQSHLGCVVKLKLLEIQVYLWKAPFPCLPKGYAILKEGWERISLSQYLSHTLHSHFVNWQAHFMGHEPDDAKDDKTRKEAGEAVANGHHKSISVRRRKRKLMKINT